MGTTLRVVGDSTKKVVDSGTKKLSEEDLLKAENQLREEARNLVREIENKYWDLSRVLYDVYDGVPGGHRSLMSGEGSMQDRRSLFEKWGYKNFGEYCEQEVGLRKRTAENLRYAYYWFTIQQPMPDHIINELISIGRSKLYLLSGVANKDNVTLWIEKAKELTFEDLKKAIKMAKAATADRNIDNEEKDSSLDGSGDAPSSSTATADAGPKHLPKPEEWHQLNVPLADAQFETWQAAFKRAQSISNSEKVGHNLDLICQDFLSNNDFGDAKGKDRTAFISKIERKLGVLIIAVDPNSGKPVHGRDLLHRMMSAKDELEK
jgi:hypothetical protein